MKKTIELSVIADAVEMASNDWQQFYNMKELLAVLEGGVAFVTENGDLRRVRALVGHNECSYGWSKTRIRSATAADWRK